MQECFLIEPTEAYTPISSRQSAICVRCRCAHFPGSHLLCSRHAADANGMLTVVTNTIYSRFRALTAWTCSEATGDAIRCSAHAVIRGRPAGSRRVGSMRLPTRCGRDRRERIRTPVGPLPEGCPSICYSRDARRPLHGTQRPLRDDVHQRRSPGDTVPPSFGLLDPVNLDMR